MTARETNRKVAEEGRAERILRASEALFIERGYDGVSINDVAVEAGVNKALVIYYFKTKQGLFNEVIDLYYRSQTETLMAAVAAEVGVPLTPGLTRRNVVTRGIALPSLVGQYFAVGEVLLFGTKRCPPCTHLERLTGWKLVKALAARGGVNAAVFVGGAVSEGDAVRLVSDEEAAGRGAPIGADRPVPRLVALPD